ncbi:MAG: hypothetical protein JNN25_01850 [Candidatus Kapabacteria bacterium]|nr:hypothetical protein [Candidatus Kapabacteria bacterium]
MSRNMIFAQNAFFACVIGILLFACSPLDTETIDVKTKLQERFTLGVGQMAEIQDESLRVHLDSVPEDSRCPINAVCIWAGNARVRLTLTKGGSQQQQLELNTTTEPKTAKYLGYSVQLVELTPLPTAGEPTKSGDYRATLLISKQ